MERVPLMILGTLALIIILLFLILLADLKVIGGTQEVSGEVTSAPPSGLPIPPPSSTQSGPPLPLPQNTTP